MCCLLSVSWCTAMQPQYLWYDLRRLGGRLDCLLEEMGDFAAPTSAARSFSLLHLMDDFGQKPDSALSLIDPHFNQAGGGDVVVLFTEFVRGAEEPVEPAIVVTELLQHVLRV